MVYPVFRFLIIYLLLMYSLTFLQVFSHDCFLLSAICMEHSPFFMDVMNEYSDQEGLGIFLFCLSFVSVTHIPCTGECTAYTGHENKWVSKEEKLLSTLLCASFSHILCPRSTLLQFYIFICSHHVGCTRLRNLKQESGLSELYNDKYF
jgi:hypothetical protein